MTICLHILLGEEYGIFKTLLSFVEREVEKKIELKRSSNFLESVLHFECGGDFVG